MYLSAYVDERIQIITKKSREVCDIFRLIMEANSH